MLLCIVKHVAVNGVNSNLLFVGSILKMYFILMVSDFGGMTFEMDNKFKSDLAIYVCTPEDVYKRQTHRPISASFS